MKVSLLEFSVENFKIFKDRTTFSMVSRKSQDTFLNNGENLQKRALIYGPNASGKSTLLEALKEMKRGVMRSHNNADGDHLPYKNFLLSDKKNKPIFWEIIFSIDKKIFKYNFSIIKDRILSENLVEILSNGKEKKYLNRNEQKIKLFNSLKKSCDIIEKTRKEVLFISAASQWNDKLAMNIVDAFKHIHIIKGNESSNYGDFTLSLFQKNKTTKTKILNLLKEADFCIDDGFVEKIELPDSIKKKISLIEASKKTPNFLNTIFFTHPKYNAELKIIGSERIHMSEESIGTQKFFDILGPIIKTVEDGDILFIDEFDNSLHPILTKFTIDIFSKKNPNNAQIIVTSHDTSLLTYKNDFDKSQIWFTEKDRFGAGKLFSLSEFKLRNDTEYSKKYLEGRFGALPFIELS